MSVELMLYILVKWIFNCIFIFDKGISNQRDNSTWLCICAICSHLTLAWAFVTKQYGLSVACSAALYSLLWGILSKFGCPLQFLAVLREFHHGMTIIDQLAQGHRHSRRTAPSKQALVAFIATSSTHKLETCLAT